MIAKPVKENLTQNIAGSGKAEAAAMGDFVTRLVRAWVRGRSSAECDPSGC